MLTPEVVLSWGSWSRYEHPPGSWGACPASGLQSPRGRFAPCVLGLGPGSACVLSLCLLRAFSVWAPCHISFLSKVALKKPSSKERLFVLTWLLPFGTEQANGGIYFSHLELNAALSRTSRCRGGFRVVRPRTCSCRASSRSNPQQERTIQERLQRCCSLVTVTPC